MTETRFGTIVLDDQPIELPITLGARIAYREEAVRIAQDAYDYVALQYGEVDDDSGMGLRLIRQYADELKVCKALRDELAFGRVRVTV